MLLFYTMTAAAFRVRVTDHELDGRKEKRKPTGACAAFPSELIWRVPARRRTDVFTGEPFANDERVSRGARGRGARGKFGLKTSERRRTAPRAY